jgi:hypothetical protein
MNKYDKDTIDHVTISVDDLHALSNILRDIIYESNRTLRNIYRIGIIMITVMISVGVCLLLLNMYK